MSASYLEVTSGSGVKLNGDLKTIGANSVVDQYVLHGEQANASYIINGAMSAATANSHLFAIQAGASLKLRVRLIQVYQRVLATTAAYMTWGLYRTTTAGTGGSAMSTSPLDSTEAAAGAVGLTLNTVKGTEGSQILAGTVYLMQTAAASAPQNEPILTLDFDRLRTKPLIISAGTANGVVLKNITGIAGALLDVNVWLDETSY